MAEKSKNSSKVLCYTGVYSRKNGIHMPKEFLRITRKFANSKSNCTHWKTGKYTCPPEDNVTGWMKWTGAEYMTRKACKKAATNIQKAAQNQIKQQKKEKKLLTLFDKCRTRKCAKERAPLNAERSKYTKEQEKACPPKSRAFVKCSRNYYNTSELKKLENTAETCAKKECAKEYKKLNKLRGLPLSMP